MEQDHSKTKRNLILFLIIAASILIIAFVSAMICISSTSYFVSSEDGLWKVGAYKEEPFVPRWCGQVFYFGEEPIEELEIETMCQGHTTCYSASPPAPLEYASWYTRFLARKSITSMYYFADQCYDDPKLEQVTLRWTDKTGIQQELLFEF